MHAGAAIVFNGAAGTWAEKFQNTFGKYELVPNENDGLWTDPENIVRGSIGYPYKLVNRDNPKDFKEITSEEAEEFKRRKQASESILSGKPVIDPKENLNPEQMVSAFLSTLIGTMPLGAIGGIKNRKMTAFEMAKAIDEKPYLRDKLITSLKEVVS